MVKKFTYYGKIEKENLSPFFTLSAKISISALFDTNLKNKVLEWSFWGKWVEKVCNSLGYKVSTYGSHGIWLSYFAAQKPEYFLSFFLKASLLAESVISF